MKHPHNQGLGGEFGLRAVSRHKARGKEGGCADMALGHWGK